MTKTLQAATEARAARIPLWVDLRHVPVNKRLGLLHAAESAGAERVLVPKDDPHLQRAGLSAIACDASGVLREGRRRIGRILQVTDARSQTKAAAAAGIVVADAPDWRIIPLENLVAARADRPGTLYALARTPADAALFAQALETGVHGVVLAPQQAGDILEADRLLRAVGKPASTAPMTATAAAPAVEEANPVPPAPKGASPVALVPARITRIADGGMGDRVCVDCTSLFADGEGLLVGSTARSFALVHAETPATDLVEARPFRVNAGAVHSYVLSPGGKTRYLSELSAGEPVLAVGRLGTHRTLTVGRCKVERRPHLILHWKSPAGDASVVLQNAETIRLVRPDGTLAPVTALKPGDEVLVHHEEAARHAGMPVREHLEER
jgi:3-dehydroquinate synthase II